jgi:hypothetical protein
MRQKQVLLIGAGLVICVLLAFLSVYFGLIALIVVLVLVMTSHIMEDTTTLIDVAAVLSEDAKHITVTNRGNIPAVRIHVALVPLNIEFDLDRLDAEKSETFPLDGMVEKAKAVVSFEDEGRKRYEKIYQISSMGGGDDDVLKPAFPLFKWK